MSDEHCVMGEAFSHWQGLSDAYAEQLEALRRHEPGASAALRKISSALAKCQDDAKRAVGHARTPA